MKLASLEMVLVGSACTNEALGFENPDEDGIESIVWIPRSQIDNLDEVLDGLEDGIRYSTREVTTIHIPLWMVVDKELDMYAEELD